MSGTLYFGDNLHVLREYVKTESVDLIYLDPPFNSKADYNILFKAKSAKGPRAQIEAFEDTWGWGPEAEQALDEIRSKGGTCTAIIRALREALGPTDMMAYVVMMTVRLIELHRVLKNTGSIYLHCDPTACHYLRIVLDSIFGPECFVNQITWKRSHAHNDAKQGSKHFGRNSDIVLFYAKSSSRVWNHQYTPYNQDYIERDYRRVDLDGRRYRLDNIQGPGGADNGNPVYEVMGVTRAWRYKKEKMQELIDAGRIIQTKPGAVPQYKRYLDEMPGVPTQEIWSDLKLLNNRDREALGYPTQKPLSLLDRIIIASSNEGDVVLDPFCGCGTAVESAQHLKRNWIGIDVTHVAIHVIADRLKQRVPGAKFNIVGQPRDVESARALADLDKYQFQWWATWLAGGQPYAGKKKGADGGVDGTLEFAVGRGQQSWGVISVKGGKNLGVGMIRELDAVIRTQGASLGVLVILAEPTKDMEVAAVTAGYVILNNVKYPKIQIKTVEQLLSGEVIKSPYVLSTVQEAPSKTAAARAVRKAVDPQELHKQRSFMFAIEGGMAAREPEFALSSTLPARAVRKRA